MVDQIQLPAEEQVPTTEPVQLPSDPYLVSTVSPDIAAEKTVKAKIGLPAFDMPSNTMFQSIIAGQEDQLRAQAASSIDLATKIRKTQVINELAQQQKKPFTPIEAQTIQQFLDTKPTDPKSVFEEFYAKNYVDNINKAARDNPDSYINELKERFPEYVDNIVKTGADYKAKKEFGISLFEEYTRGLEEQSWPRYLFDWVKGGVPFYREKTIRDSLNSVSGPGSKKFLLGGRMDTVASDLYKLPYDQYKERLTEIVKQLDTGIAGGNKQLVATFLSALLDPSHSDSLLNDVFTIADLLFFAKYPLMRGSAKALKSTVRDVVTLPDLEPFNIYRPFVPEYSGRANSMAIKSFGEEMVKNIEEAIKNPKPQYQVPRPFSPEKAFEPNSMSTNSFMEATVKGIEHTTAFRLRRSMLPEQAFNPTGTMGIKSYTEDMLSGVRSAVESASGNVKEAGVQQATAELLRGLNPASTTNPSLDGIAALQSAFDIRKSNMLRDTRNIGQETVNRIVESIDRTKNNFIKAVSEAIKVDRLPAVFALEKNARALIESERNKYTRLENNFLDTKFKYNPIDRVTYVEHTLGKTGTDLFGTERTAQAFINTHLVLLKQLPNERQVAKVEPKGAGFQVVFSVPLDETQPLVRSLLHTGDTRTPITWLNALSGQLGSIRTPGETLGQEAFRQRLTATTGPSKYFNIIKQTAEDITKLGTFAVKGTSKKQKWEEWKQVVANSERIVDPETGNVGYQTIGQLHDAYSNLLRRLPDEQEVAAYFAYANQQEIRHQLSNLQARSEKGRLGAQTHTIYLSDIDRTRPAAFGKEGFTPQATLKVDGTLLRKLPTDGETVLMFRGELQSADFKATESIKGKQRERVIAELESGTSTLIKLSNPEERPHRRILSGTEVIEKARPKYILARKVESKPLEWNQISRRTVPEVDADHFISQPIITKDPVSGYIHYEGDRTIAAFNNRLMSRDVAKAWDGIRQALLEKDVAKAKAIHTVSKIPQDFEDVHSYFKADITTEGLPIPPRLNLEETIKSVPRKLNTFDFDKELNLKYGSNLKDSTKEGLQQQLAQHKNPDSLFSYENSGTRQNPLYSIVPVKEVDPITSINRSLTRVVQDAYLNDYKLFSVEHWIQEAKDWLVAEPNSLASNPAYFFHNPTWKPGTPVDIKNNLMTAQLQIKQFLGIQDSTSTFLHAAAQNLADHFYAGGNNNAALVALWAVPKLKDPFTFIRSMTFHSKLGLGAVPQLIVQSQGFATILGMAGPKYAAPGTKAMLLHTWARYASPEVLDKLDAMAARRIIPGTAEFKRGWFTEARSFLDESGFENVGMEHALRDNPYGNQTLGGAADKFLNWGSFFFREGERSVRTGAYYTAYLEFREKFPTGMLTNSDKQKILQRADLLANNMTRASNSALQKGVFSFSSQFVTYQLRTAELFLGKRLTNVERARLFGTYGLLYGIPAAFGVSGLPIGDYIRQWAHEDGYNVGENWINTAVTEGGIATMLHALSGQHYNVAERYGPTGLGTDALRSDKTMWNMIAGAAGTTAEELWRGKDPFIDFALSFIKDDNKVFRLTPEHFIAPFQAISFVNNAKKMITAINTTQYLSKNGQLQTEGISPTNAIFMFLSGLQPQEISDIFIKGRIEHSEKDMAKEAQDRAMVEFRRGLSNLETNPTQAKAYFANASAILKIYGYPPDKYGEFFSVASKGYESLTYISNKQFFTKDVPDERWWTNRNQQTARESLIKVLTQQENNKQR